MRIGFKVIAAALCLALCALLFARCSAENPEEIKYVIGVSQANMREPWRLVLTREIQEEAAKHPEVRVIFTDAAQDSDKQIKDIGRLLEFGADLLIVSPCDAEKLTPVVRDVYRSIPVVVLDRAVEGFDYSLFIGPDNNLIGRQAGNAAAAMTGGEPRTVLEVCGSSTSQSSRDRSRGFRYIISNHSNIDVEKIVVEDETRDTAEDLVRKYGDALADVDIIFAHNDYMALGARRAVNALGYPHIKIVGIDGFTGRDSGLELIRKGLIDETIICPTGGREAVQSALEILNSVSGVPKQIILRSHSITRKNVDAYEKSLNKKYRKLDRIINVGYSQVGAESAWRLANTKSIKEAAREFGVNLVYDEANQSQERQIEAVRGFIEQKLDVIVISPVVDSGWDKVLKEARQAGIPVLLSDRKIETEEENLFMTYFGVDAIEEGRRAMRWLLQNTDGMELPVRVVELQGTIGASPTLERHQGFEELRAEHPEYQIVFSKSGDYTIEGGRQVMEEYLAAGNRDQFDVIFAHNDDMAIGAIQALEENNIAPGVDVKIISVDGTKAAFQAMIDGKLNCAVECSPLLGPQLMKAIEDLMSGKELPLRIITDEKVYTQKDAAEEIKSRKY